MIIEEFSELNDWFDKYEYLINLGKAFEPIDENWFKFLPFVLSHFLLSILSLGKEEKKEEGQAPFKYP